MEKTKPNFNHLIFGLSIIILSIIGSYLSTSYALTENGYAVNSNNVEYKDNSSLGVTNVQAAIDGTCTKFNEKLDELRESMYPVGSIYLSTSLSTTSAVASKLGGTWEVYGSGKTLIGSGTGADANGNTQTFSVNNNTKNLGEYTHKLTTTEIPSHSHSYTPSGTISSTFSNGLTSTAGEHSHGLISVKDDFVVPTGNGSGYSFTPQNSGTHPYGHWFTGSIVTTANGNHTHTVNGSVTSTFKGTEEKTKDTGSGTMHNNIQPYITVYMYRRTS